MKSHFLHKLAVALVLVTIILGFQSRLFAQDQTLYLPVLQNSFNANVGLALSNPTLSDVQVVVTAHGLDGSLIAGSGITNPVRVTIPASSQLASTPDGIFGSGIAGKTGWVDIASPSISVKGFFLVFSESLTYMDGADLPRSPATRLIFPKVSIANGSATTINFINTASAPLVSYITLYDNSGAVVSQSSLQMGPLSGFSGPITSLTQLNSFDGYAVVESFSALDSSNVAALVGFETYSNISDVAVLLGTPDTAALRTAYAPHLAVQGIFQTRLNLLNYSAQSQTVNITADGLTTGGSAITVSRTIPAFGRIEEDAAQMFSLTGNDLITGYIRVDVQGSTQGVTGFVDIRSTDGLVTALPLQGSGFSDVYFSQIAQGSAFYTGMAFLNPNSQASVVTIDVFTTNGAPAGSTVLTLAPGERRAKLLPELIPAITNQNGGYAHITASLPVFTILVFGSQTGAPFLAEVSVQGVQLPNQESGAVNAATGANIVVPGVGSLSIPPGALSTNTSITLSSVDVSTLPDPPSGQKAVAVVDASPSGTQFSIPAKLSFALPAQFPPGTVLSLMIFNPSSGQYSPAGQAVVDDTGRTASASVLHFSDYAAAASADQLITISGISPPSGQAGAPVTISGSGFSAVASEDTVTFAGANGIPATASVTNATATSLTVTVPTNAITGYVTVSVGNKTAVGALFTVNSNPVPSVTGLSPSSVAVGTSSQLIQIQGTNFIGTSTVTYDGVAVPAAHINSTSLQITASAAMLSGGSHKIVVHNPMPGGGDSTSKDFLVSNPVPVIATLDPDTTTLGLAPPLNILGSGFVSSSVVLIDGVPAAGAFVDQNTIATASPSSPVGTHLISVSNPQPGGGVSNSQPFFVTSNTTPAPGPSPAPMPPAPVPVPTISSIAPAGGATGTTVAVTLTGTNFLAGATVAVSGGTDVTVANVTVAGATSITANFTIASGASLGMRDVRVGTANGTSAPAAFTVFPVGLTSVSPATGVLGTAVAVTLTGANFTGGATVAVSGDTSVTVSDVNVVSATSITATFTIDVASPLGSRNVTVATPAGTSNTATFTVIPPAPILNTVTPPNGVQGTTVNVTLSGASFVAGASVNASGTGITIQNVAVTSSSAITASLMIAPDAALGAHNLTVTTSGGTSGSAAFTVNPPPPAITTIAPSAGGQGSNVNATITGANFVSGATVAVSGGTSVVVSNVVVVGNTSITATFAVDPAASLGPHNVTVTTSGGTSGNATFTVNPPGPGLTSITPSSGITGSPVNVTLTGTNFVSGATVTLDGTGVTASNVTVVSGTSITATLTIAANASLGAHNVTVTTVAGPSGNVVFTVNPPVPTLSSVGPASGVQGNQVSVTLSGTNFVAGATVGISGTGVTTGTPAVFNSNTILASFLIDATASLGPRNVSVTTAGGTSGTVSFTVNPAAPTLTSISPNSGVPGAVVNVTLTGTNFISGATVAIAGTGVTASNVTVAGPTSITAAFTIDLALSTVGAHNVTVTTAGGTTASAVFNVAAGVPTLASISPNAGLLGTGVNVTLTGTNFLAGATVSVDGTGVSSGTLSVVSNTSITTTLTIAANASTGAHNVTVTTRGGTSGTATFTVNTGPPTLTAISPNSGAAGNSVDVTLTGTNFVPGATISPGAGITVSNLAVANSTTITATFTIDSAAGLSGRNVTVTTSGGTTGGVAFTVAVVAVSSISPASVPKGSIVNAVLTGENFNAFPTIAVAGGAVTASNAGFDASGNLNIILTVSGSAASGAQCLTVTNTSGTSPCTPLTVFGESPVTVGLQITSPTAVGSYDMTIAFNPAIVNFSAANASGGSTFGFEENPAVINVDNAGGTIRISHIQVDASPTGTFSVANLVLIPVGTGTSSLTTTVNSITDKTGDIDLSGSATVSLTSNTVTVD